ncbi:DUF3134 domain-containing protein [Candidatus Synechococcus calcipolaris G9]|uniref:DUF3134 domain-containing protein n=1 Tax=Candidatus Synechococcus calcipolaris G9 TaxID=1497997 RepID=A0ABT6EYQ2_9SYNE|nr:DUF3134 family protein [Candidatus Synechococcus calcipolaris]MDG2990080.1 DUF3134 domain-containing protein [Candidatus Synechococcus calcipolaris G9]
MTLHNPSLYEEPVEQRNLTTASRPNRSILDWLKQSGRFILRDAVEPEETSMSEDIGEIDDFVSDPVADYEEDDESDID